MDWAYTIKCFAAIISVLNPVGAVPLYLAMQQNVTPAQQRKDARIATLTVLAVLLSTALFGQAILSFFGIAVPAFRVGGGILLMLMAVSMLQAHVDPHKQTPDEADEAIPKTHVAVVPLGIPILAGPGSISTVMLLANGSRDSCQWASLLGCIGAASLATYIFLRAAEPVRKWLGIIGINIATRVMGMLLMATAVQFIAEGLRMLLPGLS